MPRRIAMSTLRTSCKRRADLETDTHIGTAEWGALISEKYGELYGLMCEAGSRYFETTATITATGAASYTESADHLSTIGLDYVGTDNSIRPLMELMPHERDIYAGLTGDAVGYSLIDDQVYLYPNPSTGTYRLSYIPQSPDLSAYLDADLVDVINMDGEAFLTWGTSILAKSKSESDVRLAMERESAARDRFVVWASNRSMTEPRRRPDPQWTIGSSGFNRFGNPL